MEERQQTKILLVEDNPADARLVEIYLNESTMIIPVITKVQELRKGLLIMEEEDFDIVLLDLTLPDSSGFDTIETMLSEFPEQSVIVMTGLEDETVALNSVKAGAQDFIVKGQFDGNLLSRTIIYAKERHQLQMKLENYAKAIKLNEQRLLEAQKMARIGNWELDIVTNQMYWSEEVFRILGRQQDFEPTLSDYLRNVDPAEVPLVKDAINRSTEKGQPFTTEYKISLPDGNVKYVANQGLIQLSKKTNSLSLVGTIQDISNFTSRKDERMNNIPKAMSALKNAVEKTTEYHVKKYLVQAIELLS